MLPAPEDEDKRKKRVAGHPVLALAPRPRPQFSSAFQGGGLKWMHQEQRKLEIRGIELGFTMSDKFVGFGRTAAEEDNWYYTAAF